MTNICQEIVTSAFIHSWQPRTILIESNKLNSPTSCISREILNQDSSSIYYASTIILWHQSITIIYLSYLPVGFIIHQSKSFQFPHEIPMSETIKIRANNQKIKFIAPNDNRFLFRYCFLLKFPRSLLNKINVS